MTTDTDTAPIFAAPAPIENDEPPALNQHDQDLDALCEQWLAWCRTRHLYGPAPISGTVLGKLSGKTRPVVPVDAICSAELAAFHIAYIGQPQDALDRQVFDAYYIRRTRPIKRVAESLGISRQHFYALLAAFRVRVAQSAKAIAAGNIEAHQLMVAGCVRREELTLPPPKIEDVESQGQEPIVINPQAPGTLAVGDYVFASRWSDCDPADPWHVGHVSEIGADFVVVGEMSARRWPRAMNITKEQGQRICSMFPKMARRRLDYEFIKQVFDAGLENVAQTP